MEYKGVKRIIEGSFRFCGNKEDLKSFCEQIKYEIENEFTYGWCIIHESMPEQAEPNTPPIEWVKAVDK